MRRIMLGQVRRRVTLHVAVPLMFAVLVGCAPSGMSVEQPDATNARRVDQLTRADVAGQQLNYLYFTDGPDQAATEQLILDFEREYDVTVDLEIVPFSDLETTLQARLSGGNAPDVARLTSTAPFDGDLLNLTPYVGPEYSQQFIEGVRVGMTDLDNQLVAVPSDLTMNGLFVNVDMFRAAGVPVPNASDPWTWPEMIQAATKVQQSARTEFAFAMDKSGHRMSTLLSQNGAYLANKETGTLDAVKAAQALQPLTEMIQDGTSPRDFWLDSGTRYSGANEIFLAEQVPVYLSGNWQVAQFAGSAKFEWSVVANPCMAQCGGFPGGKLMAGFTSTKNPELTALFLSYMNTAKAQRTFVNSANLLPTRQDLVDEGIAYARRPEDMAVYFADIERTPKEAFASAYSPQFAPAANELVEAYAEVVADQVELGPAMAQLATTLNE